MTGYNSNFVLVGGIKGGQLDSQLRSAVRKAGGWITSQDDELAKLACWKAGVGGRTGMMVAGSGIDDAEAKSLQQHGRLKSIK